MSSDATIVFPLIVSQTFFKEAQRRQLEAVAGTGIAAAEAAATTAAVIVESDSEIALKTKKSRIEDHAGVPFDATVRGEAKV